jgi:hypothetical protein
VEEGERRGEKMVGGGGGEKSDERKRKGWGDQGGKEKSFPTRVELLVTCNV